MLRSRFRKKVAEQIPPKYCGADFAKIARQILQKYSGACSLSVAKMFFADIIPREKLNVGDALIISFVLDYRVCINQSRDCRFFLASK